MELLTQIKENSSYNSLLKPKSTKTEDIKITNKLDDNRKIDNVENQNIIKEAIKNINNQLLNKGVEFSYEEDFFIVKLKNKETDEIINQFPTEDFLKRIKNQKFIEELSGLSLNLTG